MLRDKIEVTVKRQDAYRLKIKICVIIVYVIVSKHKAYEASCQLPLLHFETYTFVLNILLKLLNNIVVSLKCIQKINDRYVMHILQI